MEGRCGFSKGFPEGKSEGWNGARDPCRRHGAKPHSIQRTFPREIPRKTHTFLTLANKNNILYRIGVKIYKAKSYS